MIRTSALLLCLTLVSGVVPAAEKIAWSSGIAGALERAGSSASPVLLDVWAIWCAPCKEMDETTYVHPDVVDIVGKKFVPLKLDADVHGSFLEQRYAVDAFPTVLFLDGSGSELTRIEGKADAERLLRMMDLVLAGYVAYVDAMAAPESADHLQLAGNYLLAIENPLGAAELIRRGLKGMKSASDDARHRLELQMGEALLTGGEYRSAIKALGQLHTQGVAPHVQARALMRMAQAQRYRGKDADADRLLAQLYDEFPEQAANLPGDEPPAAKPITTTGR